MKHVVALSGGKDSTALSLRLKEIYPDRPFEFVYTPTGDELPGMQQHMQRLARLLGPIKTLSSTNLFDLIREQRMIPNFRARFCTRILKIEPFFNYMETLPPGSVMYVGIRKDEEDRVGMQTTQDDTFTVEKPFLEWGWGISEVTDYLKCRGIEIPKRTDCGCCFYQRLGEWKDLLETNPDRYQQYIDVEEEMGHTFRSPGRDTWPASLAALREEFQSGRPVRKTGSSTTAPACPWCSK